MNADDGVGGFEAQESFLVNRFGDEYLHSVNGGTFERTAAAQALDSHLGEEFWSEDVLNVVVGTDSGLLVGFVRKHGIPEGTRYLFVELPDVRQLIGNRIDQTDDDDGRLAVRSPGTWQAKAAEMGFDGYSFTGKVRFWLSLAATDARVAAYRPLARAVRADLDAWHWALGSQLHNAAFIDCQLRNLSEMHTPVAALKGLFEGQTVVLLAGGPSLDLVLPWVKQNREQVKVFAVSRISRVLQQEGLVPDAVFTIDPTGLSYDISREMLLFPQEVLLVAAYHANPRLVNQWSGPTVYAGPRFPWRTTLNVDNLEVSGPTVTHTAFSAAVFMGFKRIIFGGLDLCFSAEGFSHASGSNERHAGPRLDFIGNLVQTNDGRMAETSTDLQQSIAAIDHLAGLARERGCELLNPAPSAARLRNVDFKPLDTIELPRTRTSTFHEGLQCQPADTPSERVRYLGEVLGEVERVYGRLSEIRKLAVRGLELNDGLFGRGGKQADFKYKRRMDKLENRLNTRYGDLADLVKRYGIRNFLRILRPDREREWTDEEIETTGRAYYQAFIDGSDMLMKELANIRARLQSRLDEDAQEPDVPALLARWESDAELGRARKWRLRRHETYESLSPDTRVRLDQMDGALLESFEVQETEHLRKCRAEAQLKGVPTKAAYAFLHRDRERIENLVRGLKQVQSQEAEQLLRLATGYLHELDGEPLEALSEYQQVDAPTLLEDSLRRITAITLQQQDYTNALTALEILAHVSPSYMPRYAEMLRLTGDAQRAADIYARYLEHAPRDYNTLIKLGRLYLDNEVFDGAVYAFSHVLEHEPDNRTARALLQDARAAQRRGDHL